MDPILHDLSAPALIRAIQYNHLGFMADQGRSPQVTLHDDPELFWFITRLPYPRCNRILCARFEAGDIDAKIEMALAPYKARGLPALWHTGPATHPPDLGERLVAHGLTHGGEEPGMAADLSRLPGRPSMPPSLTITPVSDAATLRAWCHTFARAFASPGIEEIMWSVEASLGLDPDGQRRLYLGRLAGEPVASAALFLGAGVAGLYCVGTLPSARQRGIGRAMTLHPLLEARALGYKVGTLHASSMGVGIYRRLGFETYCRMGRYLYSQVQRT